MVCRIVLRALATAILVSGVSVGAHAATGHDLGVCKRNWSRPDAGLAEVIRVKAACTQIIKAGQVKGLALSEAYIARGHANLDLGDLKGLYDDMNLAYGLDPASAEALAHRGWASWELGDKAAGRRDQMQAIKILDKAIEQEPWNARHYLVRAFAYAVLKRRAEIVRDASTAIGLDPELMEAYGRRGWALSRLGQNLRAEADFAAAIRKHPNNGEFLNNRAWFYVEEGMPENGLPDIQRAIRYDPLDENYVDTRAHIYAAMGRKREAIRDFRHVLRSTKLMRLRKSATEGLKKLGAKPD